MLHRSLLLATVVLFGFPVSTSADQQDLSGIWVTESPVPYIVEHTPEHPHGKSVPHESLKILERSASMEWSLTQREDGLISGTNRWVAYGEDGQQVYEGIEPMVGVFDGQRAVLIEPPDEEAKTAQINFEATFEGPDRISGIGYSVGPPKLIAIRFAMVRKR